MAQQIFVTIPGMKKEPITIPDTATVADFCREVYHRTGCSLFGGFGFKGMNTSGVVALTSQEPLPFKTTNLASPAPTSAAGTIGGGTLAAATYFIKITYTSVFGETLPSAEFTATTTAAGTLVVQNPPTVLGATGWNVYISTATGTETKQNGATPVALGQDYIQTGALVGGAALPTSNTAVLQQDGTNNVTFDSVTYLLPPPAQLSTTAPITLATSTTGGTVAAGTYNVRITYVNPTGETLASVSTPITTTGTTSTITVTSPAALGDATQYKVYMGTGTPTLQGAATNIGTNFVQSTAVGAGAALPATNTAVSPLAATSLFSSIGITSGDELFIYTTPVGG